MLGDPKRRQWVVVEMSLDTLVPYFLPNRRRDADEVVGASFLGNHRGGVKSCPAVVVLSHGEELKSRVLNDLKKWAAVNAGPIGDLAILLDTDLEDWLTVGRAGDAAFRKMVKEEVSVDYTQEQPGLVKELSESLLTRLTSELLAILIGH